MALSLETKFRRTLALFKAKLTRDEAEDFNFATLDDLKKAVDDMQIQQGSAKRMQNLSRLSAFLEAMEQYDKVVQVFLNAADLLAFIWGPAKFILLTASTCVEAFNNLLDAYEEIGEHIPLLKQYENLIKEQPHLQHILGLIYEDILTFHQKAMRHFRNRMWKKLFHATWKTFQTDFRPILNHLQSHKELLHRQAVLIGIQQTQYVMHYIQQSREDDKVKTLQKQEDEAKRRRREVYSWLSAADSAGDQETARETRSKHPTTGHWILQQDLAKTWLKPSSLCEPCIWLNGKPGAGKTILASVLIEKCGQIPNSNTAFFYCRSEDVNRNTFIGVCRSILLQLAQQEASIASYIYEESCSRGRNQLDSAVLAKELLDVALNAFDSLFIVIDGIDECKKNEKDQIASWFLSRTANHSALLRCCFISQDDKDTGKLFRGLPSFQITEKHNGGDILDYCADMEITIADSFDICSTELRSLEIANTVAEKADGMFLLAKLVMENLTQQCSRADLEAEIESIPPDLDKAYDRLLVRILRESPVPEQKVARKLLCWLLCSQRPLKWREIQGAMSFDQETCTFDYKRSLTRNSKQFCGSLVEVRKGGTIELVHHTARKYLEKQDELQLPTEDLEFTCLCLGYLTLPSHDKNLSDTDLRVYINSGCYAFSDYVIAHWREHLEITAAGRTLENSDSLETLNRSIRSFCNRRVAAASLRAKPTAKVSEKLNRFKEQDFYTALAWTMAQRKDHRADKEDAFSLLPRLLRVRKIIEQLYFDSDTSQTEKLCLLYGPNVFKCSEVRCQFFHEGFSTSRERDAHQNKHRRAFLCTFPGCPALSIGFVTASELKKHEIDYHQGIVDNDTFPWHGSANSIEITKEISQGNMAAVEAWLDQWDGITLRLEFLWPNVNSPKSKSPLRAAINCGNLDILGMLLQHLPSEIFQAGSFLTNGTKGNEIFNQILATHDEDVAVAFMSRATKIYPNSFEAVLNLGIDKIAYCLLDRASIGGDSLFYDRRYSYLLIALVKGQKEIVQHLRRMFHVPDTQEDQAIRDTILSALKVQGHGIAYFLKNHCSTHVWDTDKDGQSVVSILAFQERRNALFDILPLDEAKKWINGARLHECFRKDDVSGIEEILQEVHVHLNIADGFGYTALHHAVDRGNRKFIMELAENPGVDLEAQAKDGTGALHVAISRRRQDIVRILLEAAISPDEITRPLRYGGIDTTALEMARTQDGSPELLRSCVAGFNAWHLYPVDSTPLLRFCATGSLSVVKHAYRRAPDTLNTPNSRGTTPYLQAIKGGRKEIAQFLLHQGCTTDFGEGADGYSPLMHTVMRGDLKLLKDQLWVAGEDPKIKNKAGQTALSLLDPEGPNANLIRGELEAALGLATACNGSTEEDVMGECTMSYRRADGTYRTRHVPL